jgi:TonB-linked SusC/RagA family outer membrane protein
MQRSIVCVVLVLLGLAGAGSVEAQQREVTGRVVSEAGQPIPDVSVQVLGTQQGALTRADGRFQVSVPAGPAQLRFSIIGYRTRDVTVDAGQSSVEVMLEQDVLNLDAIVVTGQVTSVARRNLANAVAQVNADQLNRSPAASVEQQLMGKIAGADIQANSGAPGGGLQVNLRGVSSIIGNATPLYVVDGVIVNDDAIQSGTNVIQRASGGSFANGFASSQDNAANRIADLNPNDIESIEVLKGASAAAIYGSKANAGVVIIKTKRGAPGAPQFSFTQRFGTFDMVNKLGLRRFETLDEAVETFGPRAADFWEPGAYFDHEEELAGNNPLSYETALSVSGGNEGTRYFASGLIKEDGGIITGTGYKKQSIRLNLDQNLGSRMQLRLSMNGVHSETRRGFTNNDNRSISYWMTFPSTPSFVDLTRDENGDFPDNPFANSNPLETAAKADNTEEVWRTIASGDLTIDALQTDNHSLRVLLTGGVDFFSQTNNVFSPADLQFEPNDGKAGTTFQGDATNLNTNLTASLVHRFTPLSGALEATTSVGLQLEDREVDVVRVLNEDLIPGQSNIDAGTNPGVFQTRTQVKDVGIFAQEELLFLDERALLVAGVRADRSSNNADTEEYFIYPKLAASYRFPELLPGAVEELKLRAAWGESGNQPQFGQKFSNLNVGNIAGLQTLRIATTTTAQDLRPERQREIEFGFDAVLLDSRANLEFTWYEKRITDLLLQRALPPTTGFNTAIFNGGVMVTDGIEAALQAVPIQTDRFQWNSTTTFSRDRSTIEELPVPPFRAGGFGTALGGFQIEEGESTTQIVGRDTVAVAGDPRCDPSEPCQPGDRILTAIGDANPDFRMGFSNEFRYGALSLYSLFDWQKGGDVVNLTAWLYDLAENADDYTDPCTASTCLEGETLGEWRSRVYPSRTSTIWTEDGSFVKLRELTLGFDVPQELVQSVWDGARYLRVNLSGRNLLVFTDYSGMDPEVSNFGAQAVGRNIDVAPYPPSRSFWISVDVGF